MRKRVYNLRKGNQPYNLENIEEAKVISQQTLSKGINSIEKQKLALFDKAIRSNDPEVIMKATGYFGQGKNETITGEKIKSLLTDPLDFASSFGYKEKPTRLTYLTLKRMASTPFTAITINTRISQVLKFCIPQTDEYTVGFKIRLRDRNASPSKEDEKVTEEFTNIILDGGYGGYRWGRDDFENFVSKLLRDSLTYDQYTFEVMENRKGIPQEFFATDASTYRIAFPDHGSVDFEQDPLTGQKCIPSVVQIYQGAIESEFYPWELCFGVRRPRTDLLVAGYGYAELEELVQTITGMLYSDEYNRRFFSQGSAPKGMIRISSNTGLSDAALKEFKRQWQMQMAGVYNSWKTPIMEADKMDWVDLSKSNRDMEYSNWQEYLIKIHSALFLIDPSELGFDIQRGGDSKGSMFEADQMKRIKYSKDKGLTPLLRHISKSINRHIIWRINEKFEFAFVGGEISEDQVLEKAIKEVTNIKNIDEVRAKFDLEPLGKEGGGNLILNPNWMSWYNNKMIREADQETEAGEGQDFGEEDPSYDPLLEDEENENNDEFEEAVNNPFKKELNSFLKAM